MDYEIQAIKKNEIFELAMLPKGHKPIGVKRSQRPSTQFRFNTKILPTEVRSTRGIFDYIVFTLVL